jgi:HlyD family secretion protein
LRLLLFAILGVAAIAGGGTYIHGHASTAGPAYLTAPVERGNVETTVTATGTVKAVVTVEVGSQLSGQIEKLFVDFNDEVHRGQPIAQLDQSVFLAKVQEAEAALQAARTTVAVAEASVERMRSSAATAEARVGVLQAKTARADSALNAAQRELNRTQMLSGKGVTSERQLDQAQAARDAAAAGQREAQAENAVHTQEIKTAAAELHKSEAELANAKAVVSQKEAELAQARVELDRTVILSPIDGVVIGRKVDRGQTVAASLQAPTLFTLAQDLREMDVHARVDEADIGRIRVGQNARFRVDAFPRQQFVGHVTQIRRAPEIEKNVVTYTVVLAAPNPQLLLLPGMTAVVDIVVDESNDALKLPNSALRFQPPGRIESHGSAAVAAIPAEDGGPAATVWVLGDNNQPTAHPVRLGVSNATVTAVSGSGLSAGQKVIVGTAAAGKGHGPFGFRLGF